MTYSSTQLATRNSPFADAPDQDMVAAINESMTVDDASPANGCRRFPGLGPVVAGIVAILSAGAVALAAAAMMVGGQTSLIFGYAIISDLGTAAVVALCWACYGPRHAAKAPRGTALRRSQIHVAKA